mmetsp:Transcript_71508/g.201956  ORF Transcript_71508/g.201956 Transcript_71508/m.201956 type:complete len:211 (-) Transcript_71508:244-876(-)
MCICSQRCGQNTRNSSNSPRTAACTSNAKAYGAPAAVAKPATAVPKPLPKPAETPPRPNQVVFELGGAIVTVQTVAQTPCKDCVAPIANFAMYIGPFAWRRPKMAVHKVFMARPNTSNAFVLQLCSRRPQKREVTVIPILSIAPSMPNSPAVQELCMSFWMVSMEAGVAPPSYDMKAWTTWQSSTKTRKRTLREATAAAGSFSSGPGPAM